MRITQAVTATLLAAAALLAGCDGDPANMAIDSDSSSPSSQALASSVAASSSSVPMLTDCGQLAQTYRTAELQMAGPAPLGVYYYGHWRMEFIGGEVEYAHHDVIENGSYACSHGQVVMTLSGRESILTFNDGYSEFSYQGVVYQATENSLDGRHCNAVAGNRYRSGDVDSSRPEEGPVVLEFVAQSQQAIFGYGDIRERGIYDCSTGTLHVHLDSGKRLDLDVERHGISVTFLDDTGLTLERVEDDPVVCTEEYAPVCAIRETGKVCITEPCPTHEYATYSNRCKAQADNAVPAFNGECGDLEGEPFYDQVACPAVYLPVCAKAPVDIQCVTAPCPNTEYKTFGNGCEADAGRAQVSFAAPCDAVKGLAGHLSFRDSPVQLINVGDDASSAELPRSEGVRVIASSISEDVLTVTLGYSGCNEQPINYSVDASHLSKSLPAQVTYSFAKQTEDLCEAYFETTFTYDLLPLRFQFKAEVEGDGLAVLGVDGPIYQRPAAR